MRRVRATALVVSGLVAGCGGGGGADDAGRSFDDFLRALGNRAPSALERLQLEQKAERAVLSAFCKVAADVVNLNRPLTEEEWVDAMEAEAKATYPDLAVDQVRSRVDRLRATVSLAQINPQLALRYVQNCR